MKTLFQFFFYFTILISSTQLVAQNTEIKRSNNKVSLNGKPYFIHIVRKGETLFAISQAYQVPKDSIKKDNLHISDDLKINQYLKIRVSKQQIEKQEFVFHQVKKGDTAYNLAVKFGTTIDKIYEYNSNAKISISIGEVLKIPVKLENSVSSAHTVTSLSKKEPEFIVHLVQKKESISGIAAKYGATQLQIEEYNPDLKTRSIEIGEKLKIPVDINNIPEGNAYHYHKVDKQQTIYGIARIYELKEKHLYKINSDLKNRILLEGELIRIPKTELSDSIFEPHIVLDTQEYLPEPDVYTLWTDSLILAPCPSVSIDTINTYKIAFFLPFNLNINDTLGKYVDVLIKDEDGIEILESVPRTGNIEDKIYPRSKIFIEFYQGALLALQNLKEKGVSFDIHIFDTQNDSVYMADLLKANDLSDFNLFIGPVYGEILQIVGDYAWEHQINIVSPLSVKSNFIEHNPYAFQVSPSFDVQMHHASEFLNDYDTKNYIVIHDGNNLDQEYISRFKTQLFAQMNEENFDQIKYNEFFYYDARDSVLKQAFTPGLKNIVIVPSSNQAFVTDVLGKLNGYAYEYDITIFGQPRWMRFENIELDNFHNTNTHIFSNSFIDYSNVQVNEFIKQYRFHFKGEPDKYAFQGYDVTKYFGLALNKYGHSFRKCIHMHKVDLLQTNFQFVPYSNLGGYQNTAIYILEYDKEGKLKKVAQFPEN